MVNSQQSGILIFISLFLLVVVGIVAWAIFSSLDEQPDPLAGSVLGIVSSFSSNEGDATGGSGDETTDETVKSANGGTPVEVRYPVLAISEPDVPVFAPVAQPVVEREQTFLEHLFGR